VVTQWRLNSVIVVVLATFLGLGGLAVSTVRDNTDPEILRGADIDMATFDCLLVQIMQEVPPAARIVVTTDETFWLQRLTEIAYPHREVVADLDDATHALILTRRAVEPDCGDLGIEVVET
jgi:hypothetical protein